MENSQKYFVFFMHFYANCNYINWTVMICWTVYEKLARGEVSEREYDRVFIEKSFQTESPWGTTKSILTSRAGEK